MATVRLDIPELCFQMLKMTAGFISLPFFKAHASSTSTVSNPSLLTAKADSKPSLEEKESLNCATSSLAHTGH